MQRRLVHLGCGPLATKTAWEDFDGSWNLRFSKLPSFVRLAIKKLLFASNEYQWPSHVKYLNLTRRFPFKDDSVDAIYASHVWEHLYFEEAQFATFQCFRVLKQGGVLRLAVPGLNHFIEQYVQAENRSTAALKLNEQLLYRELHRPKSLLKRAYQSMADFHSHKYMYDPEALVDLLNSAGFQNVRQQRCFESAIPEIREVEKPSRVSDQDGIVVEAIK
jgi:predicted SAM-dependent methyltransferase